MAAEPWVGETRPCPDTECGGTAEPEGEASLRYWACTTCGYEFGYERLGAGDGCALGIPVGTRQAAMSAAGPVLVQIRRRPDGL
jgi:hypothetical protein